MHSSTAVETCCDETFDATLSGRAAVWPGGFSNEKSSCHCDSQSQCRCVPSRISSDHQGFDLTGGRRFFGAVVFLFLFNFISSCGFGFMRTSAPMRRLVASTSSLEARDMKFWTDADIPWLTEAREKKFRPESQDHEMFLQIGFFTFAYAAAELRLTLLLAEATQIKNLHSFDLLTRGMDVRVKIERFRRACEKGPPIGQNLSVRLEIMNGTMRPLRNQIAHGLTVPMPDKHSLAFAGLAAMPKFIEGRHPDQDDSTPIKYSDFFEHSAWLRYFEYDLKDALRGVAQRGTFEIDDPQSPLLRGSDQPRDQPKPDAKPGRRERKRLRKGQPPRRL
jgi:hypothetical protein